jgi:hypothetical protein
LLRDALAEGGVERDEVKLHQLAAILVRNE